MEEGFMAGTPAFTVSTPRRRASRAGYDGEGAQPPHGRPRLGVAQLGGIVGTVGDDDDGSVEVWEEDVGLGAELWGGSGDDLREHPRLRASLLDHNRDHDREQGDEDGGDSDGAHLADPVDGREQVRFGRGGDEVHDDCGDDEEAAADPGEGGLQLSAQRHR
jgi:hypothetical protein